MANAMRGQFVLEHEGTVYRGVLDFNALAEFEGETGENALTVLQDKAGLGVRHLRALMWCGLRQFHPNLTIQDAGRIVSENQHKLAEALVSAFPDAAEDEVPDNRAGKRKRAALARK